MDQGLTHASICPVGSKLAHHFVITLSSTTIDLISRTAEHLRRSSLEGGVIRVGGQDTSEHHRQCRIYRCPNLGLAYMPEQHDLDFKVCEGFALTLFESMEDVPDNCLGFCRVPQSAA